MLHNRNLGVLLFVCLITMVFVSCSPELIYTVETPVIAESPYSSSFKEITISSSTEGANIVYTTDGSTPTENSQWYTGPVQLQPGTTIKVVAIKDGYNPSREVVHTVSSILQIADPSIVAGLHSAAESEIVVFCQTGDVEIYYTTDGTTPSRASTRYENPFIETKGKTIKVIAYRDGYIDSNVVTKPVPKTDKVPTPVISYQFSRNLNGSCYVDISSSLNAAEIRYGVFTSTLNAAISTQLTNLYTGQLTVPLGSIVKAQAVDTGYIDSDFSSVEIPSQVGRPVIHTQYFADNRSSVTISSSTPDATIYYSTDGSTPSMVNDLYEGPFIVYNGTTIRAIASFEGMPDSEISSYTPPKMTIDTPKMRISDYSETLSAIRISCSTEGVDIFYSIDGSTPSEGSTLYHSEFTVANGSVVKAVAQKMGMRTSEIATIETYEVYTIGSIGPGGGYVFFDRGSYYDGWRYLEAAPADLRVVNGVSTVDSSLAGYRNAPFYYPYGLYRYSAYSENLFTNDTTTTEGFYNTPGRTEIGVGFGAANTALLITKMGESAWLYDSGSETTSAYAAKLADELVHNGYDDWFLPSRQEVNRMYDNLKVNNIGGFLDWYYWSSSEYPFETTGACMPYMGNIPNRDSYWGERSFTEPIRPARAF